MKRVLILTMALTLLSTLFCCNGGQNGTNYGEPTYQPKYASSFEIYSCGQYSSILRIHNPWQGARDITKDLFISRQGEVPPEGFNGTSVTADPKSIICMSTSHIAFIDALGCANTVKGVSGINYVSTPTVVENIIAKKVVDIGYDTNINYELIASLKPDIVFIYGVAGENSAMTEKLGEMNINAFYICDYLENDPLGKAEWIVALGEIFNRREHAERIFCDIEHDYDILKRQAAQYQHKPRVMLNAPYRDTWFVPGDKSYMVKLINDAAGEYVCNGHDNEISRPLSGEAAYLYLSQSDLWLNPNQANSLDELKALNPMFESVDAVKNHNVYNATKRNTSMGGSDFWESGALRADIVLADMLQIIHPESNDGGRELYYFKQLD